MSITLRAARVNAGLTLEQVAEKTGFNRNSLSEWETGRREPKMSKVRTLCELYGADLSQIDLSPWWQ